MIPFNRYWIVFYQTLQDYSGGVALVEPNKMRKGLASSSHRLKPLCVHTQRLVSLCLCHPFLFSSSTHSRRWEEWTLHWTNEGHALSCSSSHPTLLFLLCTLNQAISPSLYLLSWKLVSLACDVLMKRPASVKRVKLISFEYHNLLIPLTQCTSFTCDMDGTFSK